MCKRTEAPVDLLYYCQQEGELQLENLKSEMENAPDHAEMRPSISLNESKYSSLRYYNLHKSGSLLVWQHH